MAVCGVRYSKHRPRVRCHVQRGHKGDHVHYYPGGAFEAWRFARNGDGGSMVFRPITVNGKPLRIKLAPPAGGDGE